jgi:hypothetical protein
MVRGLACVLGLGGCGMRRTAINLRLPADLLARVDAEAERLGQTRTKFIERALEAGLVGGQTHDGPAVASPGVRRSSDAKRNVGPRAWRPGVDDSLRASPAGADGVFHADGAGEPGAVGQLTVR